MSDRVHDLKTHPQMFQDVVQGRKRFEIRRDDRGFRVGDTLRLHEWPVDGQDCMLAHQGEKCLRMTARTDFQVTYILRGGEWGLEPGYVAMAIVPIEQEPSPIPADPRRPERRDGTSPRNEEETL